MVNYRDAVPCRNSFSVYVAPKTGWKRNTFHMNLITESKTNLFFPSFLSTKRHLCIIYHFTLKYKPGTLVLVEQTLYITPPVKKRQWWEFLKQLMEKIRLEIVPAAGARSKLNEIVPRATFYNEIKSTSSRLLRSWVLREAAFYHYNNHWVIHTVYLCCSHMLLRPLKILIWK